LVSFFGGFRYLVFHHITSIASRLLEIGYLEQDVRKLYLTSDIQTHVPVTEARWKCLLPKFAVQLQHIAQLRLEEERQNAINRRGFAAERSYKSYKLTLDPYDRLHLPLDYKARHFEQIKKAICADVEEEVNFANLTDREWLGMTVEWEEVEAARLESLLLQGQDLILADSNSAQSHSDESLSLLDLATSIFTCSACSRNIVGKKQCLIHACSRATGFPLKHGRLGFDISLWSVAVLLLDFLHLDGSATWEELDLADPRIACTKCDSRHDGLVQVYNWRQMIRHAAYSRHLQGWVVLKDRSLLDSIQQTEDNSSLIKWFSNYCTGRGSKLGVLNHLEIRHGIEAPRVGIDLFLNPGHPSFDVIIPSRVLLPNDIKNENESEELNKT